MVWLDGGIYLFTVQNYYILEKTACLPLLFVKRQWIFSHFAQFTRDFPRLKNQKKITPVNL